MNPQRFLRGDQLDVLVGWLHKTRTNLPNCDQVGHTIKVVGNKFAVASRFDFLPSLSDLSSQFVLNVAILGQLPQSIGQLNIGRPSCNPSLVWELTALAVVS
jgi:hypothetical protein